MENSSNPQQEQSPVLSLGEKQIDFYQVLGLTEEATYDQIKRQWLKLSLIYHPDKCDGNNDKFRQINLAYKVLSNPQNRKKYNESLAKTFDQLKEVERDVDYHVNEDFVQTDVEGKAKFDREKFLEKFEQGRRTDKELSQINAIGENEQHKMDSKSIDDLMADRDRDLEFFKHRQTSNLVETTGNNDQFNAVFNQYKMMTRSAVEEVQNSALLDELADNNMGLVEGDNKIFNPIDSGLISSLVDQLVQNHADVTPEKTVRLNKKDMIDLMNEHQKLNEELLLNPVFENNLNDEDKVVLDDVKDEE